MNGFDIQFWFTPEDELKFSTSLKALYPEVVFVDWLREFSPNPTLRSSLELSETNMVMVWNQAIYPLWPKHKPVAGMSNGPDVLVFRRSRRLGFYLPSGEGIDALTSGSLSWGGGDPRLEKQSDMGAFAHTAISIVKSMHTGILVSKGKSIDESPAGGVQGYTVGSCAALWCGKGERNVLRSNTGRHLYKVYQ